MKPTDLPDPQSHAHGTRARYCAAKCRCSPCRAANTAYEKQRSKARREGDWNGLVSAEAARAHLAALSKAGVGKRAVSAASDVPCSIVHEIVTGRKLKIRARTAKRILAVDSGAMSDSALVPAARTWKLIRDILRRGFSRAEIARRLGFASPALQINEHKILARTALAVAKLHREIASEARLPAACDACGYSHRRPERLRVFRQMLRDGCTPEEIRTGWPCLYGRNDGEQLFVNDLAAARLEAA